MLAMSAYLEKAEFDSGIDTEGQSQCSICEKINSCFCIFSVTLRNEQDPASAALHSAKSVQADAPGRRDAQELHSAGEGLTRTFC